MRPSAFYPAGRTALLAMLMCALVGVSQAKWSTLLCTKMERGKCSVLAKREAEQLTKKGGFHRPFFPLTGTSLFLAMSGHNLYKLVAV